MWDIQLCNLILNLMRNFRLISMTQNFCFIELWSQPFTEETPAAGAQVVCEALFAQRQSKSMFCKQHLYEW